MDRSWCSRWCVNYDLVEQIQSEELSSEKEIEIVKSALHEQFEVKLRSDGIVHVHYFANAKVTLPLQLDMERLYNQVTKIKRPFIFTGDEFVSVTAKARANAKVMSKRVPVLCTCIIIDNLAQKIIADYYLRFNRPAEPCAVFKKFDKGVTWIYENFDFEKA